MLRKTVTIILLTGLTSCLFMNTPSTPLITSPIRSVFVYRLPSTEADWNNFCNDLVAHDFNQIVLSYSDQWIALGGSGQESWITIAHESGLEVVTMILEHTKYLTDPEDNDGLKELNTILNWNKKHPEANYDGMVIDIEPHALFSESTDAEKVSLSEVFSETMNRLAAYTDLEINLPTWICIGWWYDKRAEDGTYPALDVATFAENYAGVIPMIYGGIGDTSRELIERSTPSLNEVPVITGVGASEYNNWQDLVKALDEVNQAFLQDINYKGTIVFEADRLMTLSGW